MKASLVSLIALLVVLAGCPETPTEADVDVVPVLGDAA
jgi:hypothetical protein